MIQSYSRDPLLDLLHFADSDLSDNDFVVDQALSPRPCPNNLTNQSTA